MQEGHFKRYDILFFDTYNNVSELLTKFNISRPVD